MSSSEEDIPEPSTPFKTIQHQPPTCHPTSNKKQSLYSPPHRIDSEYKDHYYQRRPKSQRCRTDSMRQSISTYKLRKYDCLKRGRYQQASHWQSEINRTRSMIGKMQLKRARMNTIAEKRSIRQAYNNQISFFESAWNNYFQRFKQVEEAKIEQFKAEEASQIEKAREKLRKRCNSLQNADPRVIQLQKAELYHLRKGNIQQVAIARIEKKKIIVQIKKERKKLMDKWTIYQEEALTRQQSRKYQVLMAKLQQRRKDQQQNYALQRKRLRQKYKNVLSQLRHQQKMTLNFVAKWTQTTQL